MSQATRSPVTTPSSGRAPTRAGAGWLVAVAATVAAIVVAIVVGGLLSQLVHPFLRHDDWQAVLPQGAPGSTAHVARNRYEGRWLNTVYWFVVGQRAPLSVAMAVFVAGYAAFVAGLVRLLRLRVAPSVFLATLALLVSPVWVRLAYWPGTLSAAMLVAGAAVWTLPWARRRHVTLGLWLVGSVVASVLSYPPVALLLLLALALCELAAPVRRLVLLAGGFVAAYGLGVLLTFALNALAFGQFGVTISAWRRPNPLRSPEALVTNVGRYLAQLEALGSSLGWAWVVGAVGLVVAVAGRSTRRSALVVLGAVGVVVALEGGLTVVTGVVAGERASLWAWPAICLPIALLLKGIRPMRRFAAGALAIVAALGLAAWRADLGDHQTTRQQYDAIVDETAQLAADHPGQRVVLWMEPRWRVTVQGSMTAVTLRSMLYVERGLNPRWCRPVECDLIAHDVARHPSAASARRVDGMTVMLVPSPPPWL
ncbi:hypothetical protein GCM10023258_04040 [Terrabacter aeriphilus]|uniref:Mannosyltransferase n=1 Tax=Terrabacter aeriphilus TaxID=515662 RepID=A0ABP9J1H6_9MICO